MIDVTYDPSADAAYFLMAHGKIDHQQPAAPFLLDVDAKGRVLGIEILAASKVLAPGAWQNARRPDSTRSDAAE